jgi:hypothetical protein
MFLFCLLNELAIHHAFTQVKGLYLLACSAAGLVGGTVGVVFYQTTKLTAGGFGGFLLGLFVQALHNNGVIKPVGMRYIMYICTYSIPVPLFFFCQRGKKETYFHPCAILALASVGFAIPAWNRIAQAAILVSTSLIGSTALVLGVVRIPLKNRGSCFFIWLICFSAGLLHHGWPQGILYL